MCVTMCDHVCGCARMHVYTYVCTYVCISYAYTCVSILVYMVISLQVIRPYIPQRNPVLGKHIYEMVLNEFLNTDIKVGI